MLLNPIIPTITANISNGAHQEAPPLGPPTFSQHTLWADSAIVGI